MEIAIAHLKQIVAMLEKRISFDQIASRMNIEIVYEQLSKNLKGFSVEIENQWYVCLKEGLTDHDREMTLGHELAHVCLGIKNDALAESFPAEMLFEKRLSEFFESVKSLIGTDSEVKATSVFESLKSLCLLQKHLLDEQRKRIVDTVVMGVLIVCLIILALMGIQKLIERNTLSEA